MTVVEIAGPLDPTDIEELCARARLMVAFDPAVFVCEVSGAHADAVTVDALARLRLVAHRAGVGVVVRGASTELQDLIEVMGLAGVLGVETRR